jgi:hypothetical protein
MRRTHPLPDFQAPEPTPEELVRRKQISDRAALVDHIDHILRPPAWVYEEIEEAIRHALAGNLTARIESRDGTSYTAAALIERWELEEMLEVYGRSSDDPGYRWQ